MGKRLASIFLITLGVAIAGVIVFSLILFLAPGLSVFGIKYIAAGTHRVSDSFVLAEEVGTANFVSVRIESEQVPVSVVFTQKLNRMVESSRFFFKPMLVKVWLTDGLFEEQALPAET